MRLFARFAVTTLLVIVPLSILGTAASAQGSGETALHARLSGAVLNHIKPFGYAEYDTQYDSETGVERQLQVEVEHVNLPNGTLLSVHLNGVAVGVMRVSRGHGNLELDTQAGNAVPVINIGDHLSIAAPSGAILLNAAF
jgi:hypothetical protein